MMIKTLSRDGDHPGERRLCPCGDDQCYICIDGDDDHSFFEHIGSGDPNCLVGGTLVPPDITTAVPPPYIGQAFQSDEEALEYYSNFAKNNGFSVRRERSKGNPEHPMGVYKRELVCHRAGPPLPRKTDDVKRQRNRKASRCKCEAQMVIKKNASAGVTRWVVVNFSNVHNHELLESTEVRYPSPYRNISAVDRERILALAKSGCTESLILRALEMEKGVSPGQLAFGERDVKTFLQALKSINRESEGSELLKVCRVMKEKNPDFRYEFQLDENNKLEHVAWSYASSIRAFKVFGDVVVFDTTFHLNAYDRPVGVWFGIDNYGHTLFFCCVILLDDKLESFAWSLQAFLRLMDGKLPQTIMTDLDMGLKDAVVAYLPDVKHAFCIWHVMSKLSSWFSALLGSEFERFRSEFQRINDSETIEEFEHQWANMVVDFSFGADKHVSLLYSHRFNWALPYLQGWFFGGLLKVCQVLSIQSFFKGFLNSQTRLKDFIEQVGVAVDFQNQAGEEATTQQNQQITKLRTCMPIEEHASTILTHYAFDMFQKEIMASTLFAVYETARENYLVRHHLKSDGGHFVSCIPSDEDVHCSCKGFETTGILCRHALRVLSLKNCFFIPEKYLLTRWRQESSLFPECSSQKYRSQALRSLASILIQESAITKDRFDYVEWHLSRLLNHVKDMPGMDVAASNVELNSCFDDVVDIVTAPSVTRGRPRKVKQVLKAAKDSHTSC
ncbi:Protein FAR1-like sequence 11 [Apostasia shenzhenica]|uniref:Protein FAR1-RELATED SEQUENCE n=1 Tax=Apostasia shenzhenica TaxID=1088818 RepID=A0A2I0B9S5_9ASPA|nr:Protein FAR1-like sequence 11 [Apostasia shenzhenica]